MSAFQFVLSAICIGVANTSIEWLFIAYLFHKYQATTPQTWRPESYVSYTYGTALSVVFGLLFTFFYLKIGSHYVIGHSALSDAKLGIICFACFGFIVEIGNAIYVNFDRMFVVGKLLASCFSYIAAAVIAGLFYW